MCDHKKPECEIKGGSQEMVTSDGRLMAKILITIIQVNLCVLLQGLATKFP